MLYSPRTWGCLVPKTHATVPATLTMTETIAQTDAADAAEVVATRIYEIGYIITPSVKEDGIEKIVGALRSEIEKAGGNFIAEGAPSMIKLAYAMEAREDGKKIAHDRAYFGWLKFEAQSVAAKVLEETLKQHADIVRFIVFQTVREDTRAKIKAPTLREVRRTDTIKSTPRRETEDKAPVSEAELEKALSEITNEQ